MNRRVKLFIFMGPPGAGKGSLAGLCVKKFGWITVSTGNLCRKQIIEQTEIGKEIDLILKSGKLIDGNLMTRMVEEWFRENSDNASGIILDGYPRTAEQAGVFDSVLQKVLPVVEKKIVHFVIADDIVVDRLCCRLVCQNKDCQEVYSLLSESERLSKVNGICDKCGSALGRRSDDAEAFVKDRLNIYHADEQAILDYYSTHGDVIINLDAAQPLHDVFDSFARCIDVS